LNVTLKDQKSEENSHEPWLDTGSDRDLFLFLSAIQIAYESQQQLSYEVVRDDIKQLAEQALSLVKGSLPHELQSFFKPNTGR
jgi:hypothetical protein